MGKNRLKDLIKLDPEQAYKDVCYVLGVDEEEVKSRKTELHHVPLSKLGEEALTGLQTQLEETRRSLEWLVFHSLEYGSISKAKAAQLLGIPLIDFLQILEAKATSDKV